MMGVKTQKCFVCGVPHKPLSEVVLGCHNPKPNYITEKLCRICFRWYIKLMHKEVK